METLRLFVAVPLAESVQRHLVGYIKGLPPVRGVKWVTPTQFHITLRFLGDTPVGDIPALTAALQEAAATASPFPLVIGGLGVFPSQLKPRVFWVGVTVGAEPLELLYRQVNNALQKAGCPSVQGRFSPHITIGRVRERFPLAAHGEWFAAAPQCQPVADNVNHIVLFRSVLAGWGPVYTSLAEFSLSGGK
ncbi:MAG: RNA 2',3'-cyclic phosphodiesterase [bacterium]|jgi:2'-5' RNA ligase